jgi:3-oxoadipate CoA-transferase beta subunit
MEHRTKAGEPKIVPACTSPVTGLACVRRVYTDLAVIELGPEGATVRALCPGLTRPVLQDLTPVPLQG